MTALQPAPQTPDDILKQESLLLFPSFDTDVAWTLGNLLRTRLRALSPNAAVISISMTAGSRVVFQAASRPGAVPDNDVWIARKRATVLRWGHSTWFMGRKFEGDEGAFAAKYGLGEQASDYAIHGGAVPIFVKGVESPVAVVIVSGLKQDQDHQVVVECILQYLGNTV